VIIAIIRYKRVMTESNTHRIMEFDPFTSRLCRDIRNDLSKSLLESIQAGNIEPSLAAAEIYQSEDHQPFIRNYINSRIIRYQAILNQVQSANFRENNLFMIAILLWDQELFFEVHEWLEEQWHTAAGVEKKAIQALIRAAGTYVHIELGRIDSAQKIGSKALAGLITYKAIIPNIINVRLLIEKLQTLDPIPPKLGATRT